MAGDARRWKADLRPPIDAAPGDKISDYKLEKKLGQGATGAVHKAYALRGPLRGKVVAIKIIQKAQLNSEKRKRRVDCEITLHRELARHPAIVRFEHSFQDEEHIYILTEYCPGSTLFQYMQDNHPIGLPEDEARPIFLALVQAVSFLHFNRILHRDLKLTNVLLTDTMQIRIADFGLATKFEEATQDQEMTMCGTPNYISPEIVKRSPYGIASDVWSLGCMLVALITGRPPFQGDQVSETLHLVSKGAYRPLPRSCSRDVKSLVENILQIDPQRRPTSAEILAHPFLANGQLPVTRRSHAALLPTNADEPSVAQSRDGMPTRSPPRRNQNRQDREVRHRVQQRVRLEPVSQAKESVFNFGASVSDKFRNPWSRSQSSVYQDLVRELRHDVRTTSRGSKSKHRLQSDRSRPIRTVNDSFVSAESFVSDEPESDDNYKKHRQEVPLRRDIMAMNENRVMPQIDRQPRSLDLQGLRFNEEQLHASTDHRRETNRHSRQSSDPVHWRPRSSDLDRRLSCASDKTDHYCHNWRMSAQSEEGRIYDALPQNSEHRSGQASYAPKDDSTSDARQVKDVDTPLVDSVVEPLDRLQVTSGTVELDQRRDLRPGKTTRFNDHAVCLDHTVEPLHTNSEQIVHDIVERDEEVDLKKKNTSGILHRMSTAGSASSSDDPVTRLKFNTADLKPVSQHNKHGQVAILESGSVFVLLKKDGRQHLISPDGELITTTDKTGAQKSFNFEDLPARSLLAYRYASKFVNLARSKTVRIALDSAVAKCRLYQSDTFEVVLLTQQRKISFEPGARTIKIANHDEVLWKGLLDDVTFVHRGLVRQALIWWARCKDALDEPASHMGSQSGDKSDLDAERNCGPVVKFIDGLGWCEKHNDEKTWTMYFLDGLSLEVCTETRRLHIVKSDESKEAYNLEAGLPVDIRQRLKSISRAMKYFV